MNKKQLTIGWSKKILAFILDLFILYLAYNIIDFAIVLGIGFLVGKKTAYSYLGLSANAILIPLLIILYMYYLPKKLGNTFGRKILRIQDKFNIFWSPLNRLDKKFDDFPERNNISGDSSFLSKFLEQSNKHEEIINKYSKYWKRKNKNIDIKEMYFELSAAGCYHIELILRSEQYIDRYIQLKAEGKTPIEIAYILVKEIDGDK